MELALSAPTLISGGMAVVSLVIGSLLVVSPVAVCIRNNFRLNGIFYFLYLDEILGIIFEGIFNSL